jgi:hypothetical protein
MVKRTNIMLIKGMVKRTNIMLIKGSEGKIIRRQYVPCGTNGTD